MKMEINVINNKIFKTYIFKNKRKQKRNFMIYHFLVESKAHERIDLLITASVNIYQTKKEKSIPTVMKTCFTEGKLTKQFGNPHLSKRNPLFISEQFCHDTPLCPNFKNNSRGGDYEN